MYDGEQTLNVCTKFRKTAFKQLPGKNLSGDSD